jgi:hypothetical protein
VHSIAPELNAASDAATDVIRKLKVLTDLNLGVSTETAVFERRIEGGAGDSSMLTYRLAFGRVGRKYQIYIREDLVYQDEPGDEFDVWLKSEQLPWSSFPRDLRLLAFQARPALLQRIANKAQGLVRGVELTSRQAGEILQVLEADRGKPTVNARTEELHV